jgi:hypothetical protein
MCLSVNSRGQIGDPLTPDQLKELEDWFLDRKKQLESEPHRGMKREAAGIGWMCPNCGNAHGPETVTCPEPPKGGSLRQRLKAAST